MTSIYDVATDELLTKVAEKLKKIPEIKPPTWAVFVKTGMHKVRPPVNREWWYMRTAAVLRSIYKLGPVGVSKLRTKYGGKKRNGHAPPHFAKGSGNIIRKAMQQLQKADLIKYVEKGIHKGRIVTPKGKSLLDKTAQECRKPAPKKQEAPKNE
jgi:small subunit ribosomal protein S19e